MIQGYDEWKTRAPECQSEDELEPELGEPGPNEPEERDMTPVRPSSVFLDPSGSVTADDIAAGVKEVREAMRTPKQPKWTVKKCTLAMPEHYQTQMKLGESDSSPGLIVTGEYDDGEKFEQEIGPLVARDTRWDFSKAKFGKGAEEQLQYFLLSVRFKDQSHRYLPKKMSSTRGESKVVSQTVFPPNRAPQESCVDRTLTTLMVTLANGTVRWFGCDRAYINSELKMVVVGHHPNDEVRQKWTLVPEHLRQ